MNGVPIETKVSLPAMVVGVAWGIVAALYVLAKAYGFDPTPAQNTAIVGLGAAVQYAAQTVIGYLAPHTPRGNVPAQVADAPRPAAVPDPWVAAPTGSEVLDG